MYLWELGKSEYGNVKVYLITHLCNYPICTSLKPLIYTHELVSVDDYLSYVFKTNSP